jgi:hypothetical protein
VGIASASVHRIWRASGLQPWRTEDFKISSDPLLTGKICDVVGLYRAPPANAAVFAVDEKPQIQALQRTAPVQDRRPDHRPHLPILLTHLRTGTLGGQHNLLSASPGRRGTHCDR